MNKAFIALMVVAIYFLGDPGLQCLARVNDLKLDEITAAISLLSMPWTAS
jgi:hypothetical protein